MLEFALITRLKCHKEHDLLVHEKDNGDNICDVFMGANHEFTPKQLQKAFSIAQSNDAITESRGPINFDDQMRDDNMEP